MLAAERSELALAFGNIASAAGRVIMAAKAAGLDAQLKSDGSPVTAADTQAEEVIRAKLETILPRVPIIAEESFREGDGSLAHDHFLLVDPLDGTREFLAGRDEFTVNIALIEDGQPIVGAVFAPALHGLYLAGATASRAKLTPGGEIARPSGLSTISASVNSGTCVRAVGSRSHMDAETKQWLSQFDEVDLRPAGSSLKFCVVACGDADVYPRLAPTMEWDTAAGHAILASAGGCVLALDGTPLRYGKAEKGFKNDGFIAWGQRP